MAASEAGAPDSDHHHHHHHHQKKKKIELVSIPPFFRCPISLDLMRDPVSLCNGVTYDRPSIEAWFDRGNKTCPATMDLLPNQALTPNHTLRRLIQEWCVANRSLGIERIPTPKAPADPSQVRRLLHHLITDPSTRVQPALKELRSLAKDSLGNAICVVQNGAPTVLAFFLASNCVGVAASDDVGMKKTAYVEEALHILSLLPLDEQAIEVLTRQDHVAPLAILLNQGSMEARADVATLVERLAVDERRQAVMGAVEGITPGLVALLRDTSFFMFPAPRLLSVEKVCLKALYALNLCRRNAAQTVDSGAVEMLIERLADADVDKDTTEASLALLELLCRSAEGRGAMVAHTLGVPMIVKKLLSASDLATEHALGALLSICSHSYVSSHHQAKQADHSSPIRDAASSGACAKLCLLLQVQCTPKARTRASKLLRLLHSSINCPCSHDSSF